VVSIHGIDFVAKNSWGALGGTKSACWGAQNRPQKTVVFLVRIWVENDIDFLVRSWYHKNG